MGRRTPLPSSSASMLSRAWHSGPIVISLAAFLFSISTAAVKLMGTRIPTFEVVFFPGLVCFALTSIIQSYFFFNPSVKPQTTSRKDSTPDQESSYASTLTNEERTGQLERKLLQQSTAVAAPEIGEFRMFPSGSTNGDEENQGLAGLMPPCKPDLKESKLSAYSEAAAAAAVRSSWAAPAWLWQSSSAEVKTSIKRPELEPLLLRSPGNESPLPSPAAVVSVSPLSSITRDRSRSLTPVKRLAQLNSHSLQGLHGVGSSTGSGWTPAGFDSGDGDGCSSADDGDVLGGSSVAGVVGGSVGGGGDGEEMVITQAAATAAAHALWLSQQSGWVSVLLCVLRGVLGAASITMLFTSVTELRIKDAVTIFFCSPVIAALLEWLLIGSITVSTLIGCVLTITGVALVSQPAFIFDRPGANGLLLPPMHNMNLGLMDFDLSSSDLDPNPASQILDLIIGSPNRTVAVDPTVIVQGDMHMMGMALAAAAALCNAAAFVVARRTNASALTLTWFYHGIVVATTAVPLLLLKFPSGPVFPDRDDCLLLACVAVTQMAAQLLLNRGLQLVSATRGSAINVLQVMFSWGFDLLLNNGDQEDPTSSTSTMLSLLGSVCVVLGVLASGRVVEEKTPASGQVKKDRSNSIRAQTTESAVVLPPGLFGPSPSDDTNRPADGDADVSRLGFVITKQQLQQGQQLQQREGDKSVRGGKMFQLFPHSGADSITEVKAPISLSIAATGIQINYLDPNRGMDLENSQILDPGSFKRSLYLPKPQPVRAGNHPSKNPNQRLSISTSVPNFAKYEAAATLGPSDPPPAIAPTAVVVSRWRLGLGSQPTAGLSRAAPAVAGAAAAAVLPEAAAALVVAVARRPYGRAGVRSSSVPTSIIPRGDMTSDSASSGSNSDDSSSAYSSSGGTLAPASLTSQAALE